MNIILIALLVLGTAHVSASGVPAPRTPLHTTESSRNTQSEPAKPASWGIFDTCFNPTTRQRMASAAGRLAETISPFQKSDTLFNDDSDSDDDAASTASSTSSKSSDNASAQPTRRRLPLSEASSSHESDDGDDEEWQIICNSVQESLNAAGEKFDSSGVPTTTVTADAAILQHRRARMRRRFSLSDSSSYTADENKPLTLPSSLPEKPLRLQLSLNAKVAGSSAIIALLLLIDQLQARIREQDSVTKQAWDNTLGKLIKKLFRKVKIQDDAEISAQ